MRKGKQVISLLVAEDENDFVLTATENGYRQAHADHRIHPPRARHPGHDRDPDQRAQRQVVAATLVKQDDEIMLITTGGVLIRTRVKEIREMGRATQGVTLINLDKGEKLIGLEKVVETEEPESSRITRSVTSP